MVALSLYKGNLHKVPDVPRRWPAPTPKISLKDFKVLLHRRARALSSLNDVSDEVGTTSNPNGAHAPDSDPDCTSADPISTCNAANDRGVGNHVDNPCSEGELMVERDLEEGQKEELGEEEGTEKDEELVDGDDSVRRLVEKTDALVKEEENEEKTEAPVNPVVEKISTENATSDEEKRKKEVKEKLEILNEKKHSLVQVLKQILSAEEQLKKQTSMQGISGRPPLPLQVDTTTDSGSMTKINTPRMGSDGNPCGDMEGREAEDVSNHNMLSRHLPRMSSTSPSSDSPQRRPSSSTVPHSYRTSLGVSGSPSPLAPAGQGPPSVSFSGASYIASSPSPAASGGTSVFRDGRLPSPWN
ncbi:hypothetical protein ACS0TY_034401 [Phlomoides rotata]